MESHPIISSDEIDLQGLAIKAIRYFKKNLRFIAFCTFTGLILSIITYFMLPKVYESRMIIQSDILTESYSKEIAESLKKLIKERNHTALASRLNLSELEAGEIKSLEIESLKKEKEKIQDKTEPATFIIIANVGSKEILPKLQDGLIQFLRNNEFVKIRVRQKKDMYKSLIEKIETEIVSLDSLKRRFFLGHPILSKSSEIMLVDPTNIYSKIIELNKEKISYKNSLELADSVQLIEGFTAFQKPSDPKFSILLLAGFFGGFLLSIGLLITTHLFKLANSKI